MFWSKSQGENKAEEKHKQVRNEHPAARKANYSRDEAKSYVNMSTLKIYIFRYFYFVRKRVLAAVKKYFQKKKLIMKENNKLKVLKEMTP